MDPFTTARQIESWTCPKSSKFAVSALVSLYLNKRIKSLYSIYMVESL